jgi:hypothetical protein
MLLPRPRLRSVPVVVLLLALGCTPQGSPPSKATPQRVVAIGDLHADINAARSAFRLAGAIDEQDRWVGGDLIVVQLGDLIGRSYEEKAVLDFMFDVREQADAAGGTVHILIGNHEIFGARLRLSVVDERAYAPFEAIPGLDRDHPALADLSEHQRARGAALMPGGHYTRKLAEFPVVLKLGNTVFVHGGVTPHWAKYGVDKINHDVSQWFAGKTGEPVWAKGVDSGNLDDIVVMSRHFSRDVDADDCALLEESLTLLDAERMVVAHSVQESIVSNCDERVWAIDVGMSRAYGGIPQVLEILDDEIVTVIGP